MSIERLIDELRLEGVAKPRPKLNWLGQPITRPGNSKSTVSRRRTAERQEIERQVLAS